MTQEEKILALFDAYFETATSQELEEEAGLIVSYGTDGVTFERYLDTLNKVTAFSLADTGICDDVAYSDFFEELISKVKMGNDNEPLTKPAIHVDFHSEEFLSSAESNYALAA